METLGQFLRREREQRNISLEELVKHTKYHLSRLQALEEDSHDDLPAPPYVKGMLRSISQHLGLDVTDVLLRYQDFLNSRQSEATEEQTIGLPKLPFYRRKHFLVISATGAFLILAILVFILFRESKKLEPIGNLMVPTTVKEKPQPEEESVQAKQTVWLAASGDVWLKIQLDGGAPYSLNLHQGQTLTLNGKRSIRFFVSDASQIKLTFNGRDIALNAAGPQTLSFPPRRVVPKRKPKLRRQKNKKKKKKSGQLKLDRLPEKRSAENNETTASSRSWIPRLRN